MIKLPPQLAGEGRLQDLGMYLPQPPLVLGKVTVTIVLWGRGRPRRNYANTVVFSSCASSVCRSAPPAFVEI